VSKDDLGDERAALAQAKSALVESAAMEVASLGRALFKDGEPSDPQLQRRYRLYMRLEAALTLPAGPQRLEAYTRRIENSGQIRRRRAFAKPANETDSVTAPSPNKRSKQLASRAIATRS